MARSTFNPSPLLRFISENVPLFVNNLRVGCKFAGNSFSYFALVLGLCLVAIHAVAMDTWIYAFCLFSRCNYSSLGTRENLLPLTHITGAVLVYDMNSVWNV